MTKGILLIAYGKRNYAQMAYNLAASIEHFSEGVDVAIIHDGCMGLLDEVRPDWRELFAHIDTFEPKSAGYNKVCMDKYTPFDHTLYIDVDTVLLKDIAPLLEGCIKDESPLLVQTHGKGGIMDKNINYAIWTENTTAWAWFDIPLDGIFQSTQTSIVYFSKEAGYLFKKMRERFAFPNKYLTHHWGNSVPDELIFSGVAAHYQLDISMERISTTRPLFFGNNQSNRHTYANIKAKHYGISYCGTGRQLKKKYLLFADVIVEKLKRKGFAAMKTYTVKFAG